MHGVVTDCAAAALRMRCRGVNAAPITVASTVIVPHRDGEQQLQLYRWALVSDCLQEMSCWVLLAYNAEQEVGARQQCFTTSCTAECIGVPAASRSDLCEPQGYSLSSGCCIQSGAGHFRGRSACGSRYQ